MSTLEHGHGRTHGGTGAGAGADPGARATGGRGWVWAAVGWTAFVWVGRIRNALGDPDLRGAARVGVVAMSVAFLLLAATVAVTALRARRGRARATRVLPPMVLVAFVANTALWVARVAGMVLGGDRDAGFVAVHAVLGVVSIGLWGAALVTVRRGRPGAGRDLRTA